MSFEWEVWACLEGLSVETMKLSVSMLEQRGWLGGWQKSLETQEAE